MNRKQRVPKVTWLCLVPLMWGAWGCARPFQVSLAAADSQGRKPSVEVHMIGVRNAGEYRHWRDVSMTEYWQNVQLDPKVHVMKFGEGLPDPQTLSPSDDVWKTKWQGAKMLIILSSFPPSRDLPGDADARRLILPLRWRSWSGRGPIPITIGSTGLICEASYEPWNPFEE